MSGQRILYTLMHREIPVAELELNGAGGWIQKIGEVYEPAHVPVGITVRKGMIDRAQLGEWWRGRGIPASRDLFQGKLEMLGVATTELLAAKSYGLSLSDQYWICPKDSGLKWSEINFFENDFSEDVGDVFFGKPSSGRQFSLISPDNTSDGWLKKKWKIIGGKRCLIKGGSGLAQQEPYNEVLASRMMERLGIPHTKYQLIYEDGYPFSVCEDFVTSETELVTAWYVMQTRKKENHKSVYRHYVDCCEAEGIPGIALALDEMLVLDYLIVNEDRHQNNFGVLRNAETLEYVGAAPVYDSGTAFWWSTPTTRIGSMARVTCKPFKRQHEEQIKLVRSFDWLELSRLRGIDEEFREIVSDSEFIDETRRDNLCIALRERVGNLQAVMDGRTKYTVVDDPGMDVQEDISYHGRA